MQFNEAQPGGRMQKLMNAAMFHVKHNGEYVLVTPELAAEWLKLNVRNRPMIEAHAAQLAVVMKAGLWRPTAQGIVFDWNGYLMDGQHRLRAVVIANMSIWMLVIRGCNPDDMGFLDESVNVRTPAQKMSMAGVSNAKAKLAMIRVMLAAAAGGSKNHVKSAQLLDRALGLWSEEIDWFYSFHQSHHRLYPSGVEAGFVVARRHFGGVVDEFLGLYDTGESLQVGDPEHTLRNYMLTRGIKNQVTQRIESMSRVLAAITAKHEGRKLMKSQAAWGLLNQFKPFGLDVIYSSKFVDVAG